MCNPEEGTLNNIHKINSYKLFEAYTRCRNTCGNFGTGDVAFTLRNMIVKQITAV